mgnify:CR=1 FL=1
MYESIALALIWILIFLLTHIAFNNIKQLCLWTCKIVTTTYIWVVIWIITQIHQLPEWEMNLQDSIQNVLNGSAFQRTDL